MKWARGHKLRILATCSAMVIASLEVKAGETHSLAEAILERAEKEPFTEAEWRTVLMSSLPNELVHFVVDLVEKRGRSSGNIFASLVALEEAQSGVTVTKWEQGRLSCLILNHVLTELLNSKKGRNELDHEVSAALKRTGPLFGGYWSDDLPKVPDQFQSPVPRGEALEAFKANQAAQRLDRMFIKARLRLFELRHDPRFAADLGEAAPFSERTRTLLNTDFSEPDLHALAKALLSDHRARVNR